MDSNNQQLQNQMSNNEEFAQILSSCITHDEGYLIPPNGGSSNMRGASINISHSNANVLHQDSQFMRRESLETRIKDTSLIVDGSSSFSGVSYMPGNGSNNINIVASNCGIISSTTQQQQTFQPRQMIIPAQSSTLATPFLNYKNPRIEMTPEDPVVTNYSHLQQSPHQPNLVRNQQWNQAPLSVPSIQNHSMQFQAPNQMPEDSLKQLAPNATVCGSMCLRQLKYFIHEQQNRPQDNNIEFWRKFVEKYYSPMAKKRCCLSMTPLKDIDHAKCWACDLCGTNAAKGFEISYEFLPNMSQFYFERCVENELLYLDSPVETLLPSGSMMLMFSNAIQHSIYENFRVAHQGKLCIVFTKDLKISSWEFCVQSHEKLISHDFLSTQANELVEIAKNIRRNRELNEAIGFQAYNQVTNCNRLMAVGETLADKLELPYINEAGFSKAYFRHMTICHVFDSMKDLVGMCADNPSNNFISPIEAMKNFRESILKKQTESTSHSQMPQTPSGGGNNILASIIHSHMPQTPSGGGNNILASNIITNRRPSSSKPPLPVPSPLSYQHNLVTTQDPRMTHQTPNIRPSSYPVPNQPLFSTVSGGSSSHQQGPTGNHQINDLLARMNNTDGTTTAALSKGKGIDYSGGSRSYARAFAGNSLTIREPLPSDGAASGFGHPQVGKK